MAERDNGFAAGASPAEEMPPTEETLSASAPPEVEPGKPEAEAAVGAEAPAPLTEDTYAKDEKVSITKGGALAVVSRGNVSLDKAGSVVAIVGNSMDVKYGGTQLAIVGNSATFNYGGAQVVLAGNSAQFDRGGAGVVLAGKANFNGQSGACMVVAGSVKLEEGARVLMSTPQALAFGAACGVVCAVLGRALRRKK